MLGFIRELFDSHSKLERELLAQLNYMRDLYEHERSRNEMLVDTLLSRFGVRPSTQELPKPSQPQPIAGAKATWAQTRKTLERRQRINPESAARENYWRGRIKDQEKDLDLKTVDDSQGPGSDNLDADLYSIESGEGSDSNRSEFPSDVGTRSR